MPGFKPFDDETLCALDAAHGDVRVVRGETPPAKRWKPAEKPEPPWEAVFRRPTEGELSAFERAMSNDKAKDSATRSFAKAIVCGVSLDGKIVSYTDRGDVAAVRGVRDAWDALRERHPGAHLASVDEILSLASMSAEQEGKG